MYFNNKPKRKYIKNVKIMAFEDVISNNIKIRSV